MTLRNLQINPIASPDHPGIDFQNGAALFVEHCVIENWNAGSGFIGINFAPPAGVNAKLHVTDSVIKNNGNGSGGGGILVMPSGGGTAKVEIERTVIQNNTYGVVAYGTGGTAMVEIKDSIVGNNQINGVWAYSTGTTASIILDHSASIQNGGNGIVAQGSGGYVTLSDSTVAWNTGVGLSAPSGGLILSYVNNRVIGNFGGDGVTPTSFALK